MQIAAHATSIEEFVAEAMTLFGRIDIAISNDAADVNRGPVQERSAAEGETVPEPRGNYPWRRFFGYHAA